MVLTTMGTEKMTVEAAQEAMFFIVGQDSKSENSGRWNRGPRKEIFYAGESWGPEEPEDEDFPSNYLDVQFLSEDEGWLDFDQDYYDQPAEDYGEAVEVYDVDEYDDVYSAYVDAKDWRRRWQLWQEGWPQGQWKEVQGQTQRARTRRRKGQADARTELTFWKELLGNNYVANQDTGHGIVLRVATVRSGSGSMTMPRISTWSRTWMPRYTAWMMEILKAKTARCKMAAQVLSSDRDQVKKYIKYLAEKGVDMAEVEVYPCAKGFRYGNSQMEETKTCVAVPTYMGGKKRKMLVYVIGGTAPILVGRPVLEKMGIAVDYGKNMMRWPDREWHAIKVGPKGEHSLHLEADIKELKDAEVAEYLIPESAEGHVDLKSHLGVQALLVAEDDNLEESYAVESGTVPMDMDDVVDEGVSEEPSQQNAVGLDAGGLESPKTPVTEKATNAESKKVKFVGVCMDNSSLKTRKLTTPMHRKMIREAEEVVSSRNKILRMARTCERGKPIRKIWELSVGEGQQVPRQDERCGIEGLLDSEWLELRGQGLPEEVHGAGEARRARRDPDGTDASIVVAHARAIRLPW